MRVTSVVVVDCSLTASWRDETEKGRSMHSDPADAFTTGRAALARNTSNYCNASVEKNAGRLRNHFNTCKADHQGLEKVIEAKRAFTLAQPFAVLYNSIGTCRLNICVCVNGAPSSNVALVGVGRTPILLRTAQLTVSSLVPQTHFCAGNFRGCGMRKQLPRVLDCAGTLPSAGRGGCGDIC